MTIFADIYDCKALSTIHFLAEEAIAEGADGKGLKYLKWILEETDLDEIWIIALLAQKKYEEAWIQAAEVDGFRARKAAQAAE